MITLTDLFLGYFIAVGMMLLAHRWYYGTWW